MVKGVNKLIVEVANPDSEFFERAIFFVKPQMKDTPPKELSKSADFLMLETGRQKKRMRLSGGIIFVSSAGFGAAIAAILIKLIS